MLLGRKKGFAETWDRIYPVKLSVGMKKIME